MGRLARCFGHLGQLLAAIAILTFHPASADAAENGRLRLGADYDMFFIGGQSFEPCERACNEDPRCKAWSFIRTTGQCRLKHTAVASIANNCCVSGLRTRKSAASDDEVACAELSVVAIEQNDANLAQQCGYRGPLWPADFRTAYGRCLDNSPRRRQLEANERKTALADCKRVVNRSADLACDHFARMALAESDTNAKSSCGFSGEAWTAEYDRHFNWCKTVARAEVSDRIANRERRLLQCISRGGGSGEAACEVYAQTSVGQFVKAQQLKCGRAFAGGVWHADAAQHYQWCQAHSAAERDDWVGKRTALLEKCEKDRKRFKFILKF